MAQTIKATATAGFSLIETLAAVAIFSFIIMSLGLLLHDGVLFFDRGTRTIDQNEALSLALNCLRADFGAARFVVESHNGSRAAAFMGGTADGASTIRFITGGGRGAGPQGLEIVSLSVEALDGESQLVRRRAAWPGPVMPLANAHPGDAVVLLKGAFDIAFTFSELETDGTLVWHNDWTGDHGLPHSVRLVAQDLSGRSPVRVTAEFPIHANAPAACTKGKADCLSLVARNVASQQTPMNGSPARP